MCGGWGHMRNLCTFSSVFGEPQTALKHKVYLETKIEYHSQDIEIGKPSNLTQNSPVLLTRCLLMQNLSKG